MNLKGKNLALIVALIFTLTTLLPVSMGTNVVKAAVPITVTLQNSLNGYNGSKDVSDIKEYIQTDGSSWMGYFSNGQSGSTKIWDDGVKGHNALIDFDISQIPAGSIITSAQLKMYAYWGAMQIGSIDLYRITDADNKGMWVDSVLQNPLDPDNCYRSSGAAFLKRNGAFDMVANPGWTNTTGSTIMDSVVTNAGNPVSSANITFTNANKGIGWYSSTELKDDVQAWVNGTAVKQGWYMRPRTGTGVYTVFASNEVESNANAGNNPAYKPQLVITYIAGTATATPTPTLTPTPSTTPTKVPTPTPTPTVSPTPVVTGTQTPTATAAATPISTIGPAQTPELPRVYIDTTYSLPTGGKVIHVPSGGDLQAAINAANLGDIIELQAGAFYMGTFTLPNKTGNGWIYITSSAYGSLPAPGTRISPLNQSNMPKIISPNANTTIKFSKSAHNYRFVGIEIATLHNTVASTDYSIIDMTISSATQVSDLASNITFDRCYIHGTSTGNTRRGIAANSGSLAVIDSYISDIHEVGADNQAIGGWNGPGPFKFVNNYLSAACENVMFGGSDATDETFQPQDIEIRNNYFFKPLSWRVGDPSYAGIHWSVKNIFELKNAKRAIVDGNVFENHWADAQAGPSILLTPRNQNGTNPWACVTDVTITNNVVRHVSAGFNILGMDAPNPSKMTERVLIKNNILEDIGSFGGGGVACQLLGPMNNVNIDHNTVSSSTGSILVLEAPQGTNTNFKFINNIVKHNNYGIIGSGYGVGNSSINFFFTSPVITKNILSGGSASSYPAGNFFPANMSNVGFVNYNNGIGGDYHLGVASTYKSAGTDGKDLGADIDSVNTATNGVAIDLGPIPTPELPPSQTPTPTPVPTPIPTYIAGPGDFTYSFEDVTVSNDPIIGIHGGINFGTQGKWTGFLSSNGCTGCGCYTNNDTSNSIIIPNGKVLKSIKFSSPANGVVYIISDGINPDIMGTITAVNTPQLIATGWTNAGNVVTVSFSNGWDSVMDDITYGDATTIPDPGGVKTLRFGTSNQGPDDTNLLAVNQFTFFGGTEMTLYGVTTIPWQLWRQNNVFSDKGASDSFVQYKFDGVQVQLFGEMGPYCGIAAISILDANGNVEIAEQKVDCYNATTPADPVVIYKSPILPAGVHSIKVRITGEVNSNNLYVNDGNTPPTDPCWTINLYKMDVYGGEIPEPTPTATPAPTVTPTPAPTPTVTPTPTPLLGDVTGDGKITPADALNILHSVSGKVVLTDAQKAVADVTKNGLVQSSDALKILQYCAGKIPSL